MGFGIFIHRTDSIYDDSPAERYQFPAQYLGRVEACVGDWIIYLEPSKVPKSRGYFATAKVQRVVQDDRTPAMYLAAIEPGSYLDFAKPVPFRGSDGVVETGLLNLEGRISGRSQSAVRPLSATDFNRIINRGLDATPTFLPRLGEASFPRGLYEHQSPFGFEQSRERSTFTASRVLRDRVFRQVVLNAYDSRCAITGLKIINGGGRAEVEAAHIRPVEEDGPDIVSNGIALSGTIHWMFDRGLIGIDDDLRILISRHINDAAGVMAMINGTGHAFQTDRVSDRPNPKYLRWHRENCFKD